MGAEFRRELRLNPGGQWDKSCTDPGPQNGRDCSWALITGFDRAFIVLSERSELKFDRLNKKIKV